MRVGAVARTRVGHDGGEYSEDEAGGGIHTVAFRGMQNGVEGVM